MKALYFVAGAGIASVITYILTKNHYAKKADEEIAAMREYYRQKNEPELSEKAEEILAENARMKPEMDSIIKNYSSISSAPVEEVKEEPKITPGNEPFVITEEKFDEIYEGTGVENDPYEFYEVPSSYRYYANGVLVDSKDNVVDMATVVKCIGLGNLKQLAMQDDDIIYIENDVIKMAYEIIREEEDYVDPHIEG